MSNEQLPITARRWAAGLVIAACLLRPGAARAGDQPHFAVLVGYSAGGRPILAYPLGAGPKVLALVGGIHGGSEWATVALVERLRDYYEQRLDQIPASVTLVLIPNANPDGYARGRTTAGRFNANGVDLNRNWDCNWRPRAGWSGQAVNPGRAPFSEPETAALRDYLLGLRPVGIVFYHSRGGVVSTGVCAESLPDSVALAQAAAIATGYAYNTEAFYNGVYGDSSGYFNLQGIPTVEIELSTHTSTDWGQNLAGVKTMLGWALGR